MTRPALVIVASTRAAAGTYADRSGPILVDFLRAAGFDTPAARVVPDAEIAPALAAALAEDPAVVLTSGGTGLTPDDQTVAALRPHLERELPGIVQAFFARGLEATPHAILSQAVAGTVGRTFVMALPGSPGAARDAAAVLSPVLTHLVAQLEGNHDH